MGSDEPRSMDLTEFVERGYLVELNRQWLHPLGLALEVDGDVESGYQILGISDARDDPEGLIYGPGELAADDTTRALLLSAERSKKTAARLAHFGWIVQPLP